MGSSCCVCEHPERQVIDQGLLTGGSVRGLAGTFKISKSAIGRHRQHIKATLQQSAIARDAVNASTLIGTVQRLIGELESLKTSAQAQPRGGPEARKVIESILRSVALLADLCGAKSPQVRVNVDITPSVGLAEAEELLLLLLDDAGKRQLIRRLQCAVGVQQGSEALILQGENSGELLPIVCLFSPGSLEALQWAMRIRNAAEVPVAGD